MTRLREEGEVDVSLKQGELYILALSERRADGEPGMRRGSLGAGR